MRLRLVIGVVTFFILISLAVALALVGSGPVAANEKIALQSVSHMNAVGPDNVTARENTQLGTPNWEIPANREASTQIQAYASATSVTQSDKLTFYVSTEKEGDRFSVEIYRLGWYAGDGGRLLASQTGLI